MLNLHNTIIYVYTIDINQFTYYVKPIPYNTYAT